MKTFKPGDVVQLKSGGPSMTVILESTSADSVVCQWFKEADPVTATFLEDSLVLKPVRASRPRIRTIELT
jgi:uncharacterized protein YodC (DUF2158 family)